MRIGYSAFPHMCNTSYLKTTSTDTKASLLSNYPQHLPLGNLAPKRLNLFGFFKNSTTSLTSSLASSI